MSSENFLGIVLGVIAAFFIEIGALFVIMEVMNSSGIVIATFIVGSLLVFFLVMRLGLQASVEADAEWLATQGQQQPQAKPQEIHYHYHAAPQLPDSGPPPLAWRVAEIEQRNEIVVRR